MDLPTAEQIKDRKVALIAGLLIGLTFGAGAAWTASTRVHDAQFKVLAAVNQELQRQVAEFETSSRTKDGEIAQLREQLSMLSPQRREAEAKRRKELEVFIRGLDKEIAERKARLWRPASATLKCDANGENCRMVENDHPASSRLARELDDLQVQRHEARKRLIDVLAQ